MSRVVIEKFVDGTCVDELQLPLAPLQCLARLLPGKARQELLIHGLDIDALLNAPGSSAVPQWMEVEENSVAKRIRISRRD